jgi:hypothetical protein
LILLAPSLRCHTGCTQLGSSHASLDEDDGPLHKLSMDRLVCRSVGGFLPSCCRQFPLLLLSRPRFLGPLELPVSSAKWAMTGETNEITKIIILNQVYVCVCVYLIKYDLFYPGSAKITSPPPAHFVIEDCSRGR